MIRKYGYARELVYVTTYDVSTIEHNLDVNIYTCRNVSAGICHDLDGFHILCKAIVSIVQLSRQLCHVRLFRCTPVRRKLQFS